ncbi:MAG TPA: hypothetical protein VIH18_28755 [Candidatus Binatia bacterium]
MAGYELTGPKAQNLDAIAEEYVTLRQWLFFMAKTVTIGLRTTLNRDRDETHDDPRMGTGSWGSVRLTGFPDKRRNRHE